MSGRVTILAYGSEDAAALARDLRSLAVAGWSIVPIGAAVGTHTPRSAAILFERWNDAYAGLLAERRGVLPGICATVMGAAPRGTTVDASLVSFVPATRLPRDLPRYVCGRDWRSAEEFEALLLANANQRSGLT